MFDIHKIRPVHGWREFIGEVGIIVLGVLIALGAEQVVESVHWRHQLAAARTALKGELTDAVQASAERLVVAPCLNAQLDILENRVLASGATLTPAPVVATPFGPSVYRHGSRGWDDTIWQSTLSEQIGSHFDRVERENLAQTYSLIVDLRRLNIEENAADGPLKALSKPLSLDATLRGHFVEMIEAERQRVNLMSFFSRQAMQDALNVSPDLRYALTDPTWVREEVSRQTTYGYCRAHRLPLAPLPKA